MFLKQGSGPCWQCEVWAVLQCPHCTGWRRWGNEMIAHVKQDHILQFFFHRSLEISKFVGKEAAVHLAFKVDLSAHPDLCWHSWPCGRDLKRGSDKSPWHQVVLAVRSQRSEHVQDPTTSTVCFNTGIYTCALWWVVVPAALMRSLCSWCRWDSLQGVPVLLQHCEEWFSGSGWVPVNCQDGEDGSRFHQGQWKRSNEFPLCFPAWQTSTYCHFA